MCFQQGEGPSRILVEAFSMITNLRVDLRFKLKETVLCLKPRGHHVNIVSYFVWLVSVNFLQFWSVWWVSKTKPFIDINR